MAATNKQGKMAGYINYRMKVTLLDSREMQGQMLAFDSHMNLVLADTEEFRKLRKRKLIDDDNEEIVIHEEKRTLGLTIIRGAQVVSVEAISPPPQDPSSRLGKSAPGGLPSLPTGPGVARPAGRGAGSLAGPAAGIGGAPPGFPGFPGPPPGFPGRGAPPAFPPPAGFPGAPGQFPPSFPGFPGAPGAPGAPPPGFQPPRR